MTTLSNAYKLFNVVRKSTTSDVVIGGIQNVSEEAGNNFIPFDGSGVIDQHGGTILMSDMGFTFDTVDLKTALDEAGIDGFQITTDKELETFWQKYELAGKVEPGASHVKLTVNEGFMHPQTISASQGDTATISMNVTPVWDGANDPIVVAKNQSLSAAGTEPEIWTIGPLKLNNNEIEIQSVTVDFGFDLFFGGANGINFNTFVSIRSRKPVISFDTFDMAQLEDLKLTGSQPGGTADVYFRKYKKGGTRALDTATEHIKITANDYMVVQQNSSGATNAEATSSFQIQPFDDGVNDILVISTASDIT